MMIAIVIVLMTVTDSNEVVSFRIEMMIDTDDDHDDVL